MKEEHSLVLEGDKINNLKKRKQSIFSDLGLT